ncbi:glycosyltransferase [Shouchella miscanthi]|uniref:glycosyltransferase family 2 protein n=1 Tax=Shouchella miscanthi TaxID=2598861 RepID=UPI002E1C02A0
MSSYQEKYNQSIKAILGMDADSRLAPGALKQLWDDLMSARNIGGVMAKYTMRMPRKKSLLSLDDPYYEQKLESGLYGGPIARWWTHQQKQDMTSWLLTLQYQGGSTYVLGGQGTLFRPEALQDVVNRNNLDGPWQDDSDVEDMLLTWQLQRAKWKTLISPSARCFVDSMRSYHTFRQQRIKWSSGTVELLTNRELNVSSSHIFRMWGSQLRRLLDLLIRILLIILIPLALMTDQFQWSWLWIIPVVVASLLNLILALKTPMRRPIDVLLAITLISSEIYLWANLMTFIQVWKDRLSKNKKDGWHNQYSAEKGQTKSKLVEGMSLVILLLSLFIFVSVYYRSFFTNRTIQDIVTPYLELGWQVLTYLTILVTIIMIHQLWTLRKPIRA